MEAGVEVRRVDSQGRLILPPDWRESELSEGQEVYVIKMKGALKVIPKRRVNLTKFFDNLDFGVEAIGDWRNFERKLTEAAR